MLIVKNQKACMGIDVLPDCPAPVQYAAEELQKFILKKSGCTLPMGAVAGKAIVLRLSADGHKYAERFDAGTPIESYAVESDEKNIYLIGFDPAGLVYAVFDFLGTELDIGFAGLGESGVRIDFKPTLDVFIRRRRESPDFPYRGMQFGLIEDCIDKNGGISHLHSLRLDWMVQNRMNYCVLSYGSFLGCGRSREKIEVLISEAKKMGLKVQYGHHIWSELVSPEKYFDAHPEYFPMKDGVRIRDIKDMQLCLCTSNPEVAEVMAAEVISLLDKNPDIDAISLWPEDGTGMCECEECAKLSSLPKGWSYDLVAETGSEPEQIDTYISRPLTEEDNIAGTDRHIPRSCHDRNKTVRYALFVNQVARIVGKKHPNVMLSALFYHDIDSPPEGVKLEPNIQPVLAHYCRCSRHKLDHPGCENAYYARITKQWAKLYSGRLVIYDYLMGMSGYQSLPWPIVPLMHHDWKRMKGMGIMGATIQSQASHFTVYGPTYSAFARMGWDIDAATDDLSKPYYYNMYEEASGPIIEAAELMADRLSHEDLEPDEKRFDVHYYRSGFMTSVYKEHFPHCIYPSPDVFAIFMDDEAIGKLESLLAEAKSLCVQDRTRNNINKYSVAVGYWGRAYRLFRLIVKARKLLVKCGEMTGTDIKEGRRMYEDIIRYLDAISEPDIVAKGMLLNEDWGASWPRIYKKFLENSAKGLKISPFWP